MKRVIFRYTKGPKAGFETEYKEDVADILEKRGDGKIIERPKAIVVSEKPKDSKKVKEDDIPEDSEDYEEPEDSEELEESDSEE